jgi:methionyl-tRNA formyltransferase
MRVIFAGTPEFSAAHLQALLDLDNIEVVAVYTQPDRRAGRGKKLVPSPVKGLAIEAGLPVEQPLNFKADEDVAQLAEYRADLMVVVAYGLLLPQRVLDTPRLGCINVHASLLPRWRGAAPIQRCIEAGDQETGVTIMQMEAGLDTGPMLSKLTVNISAMETAGSLHDKLIDAGTAELQQVVNQISRGPLQGELQDDTHANYAHKLSKGEGEIDWQLTATEIELKIRAFNPFPIAWTVFEGEVIRVHVGLIHASDSSSAELAGTVVSVDKSGLVVATGQGMLQLTQLQRTGKRAMSVADIINGSPDLFTVGKCFG